MNNVFTAAAAASAILSRACFLFCLGRVFVAAGTFPGPCSAGQPEQDRCGPRPAQGVPRVPLRRRRQEDRQKEEHPQVTPACE